MCSMCVCNEPKYHPDYQQIDLGYKLKAIINMNAFEGKHSFERANLHSEI